MTRRKEQAAPKPTTTRAGRYDRVAVVTAVCKEVAGGETLRAILARDGRPDRSTFFQWLQQDADLMGAYREARSFAADLLFEDLEEAAEAATGCQSMTEVAALRLKLDMQRWALSKRAPKRYGEKIEHSAEGAGLTVFTLGISTA